MKTVIAASMFCALLVIILGGLSFAWVLTLLNAPTGLWLLWIGSILAAVAMQVFLHILKAIVED